MTDGRVPERGWKRPFDDPIPLLRGRELGHPQDAGTYIMKLPKAEHEAPEWQAEIVEPNCWCTRLEGKRKIP
jgi:hypothetical protein